MTDRLSILVTGSRGQLGNELQVLSGLNGQADWQWHFTDRTSLDINDFQGVHDFCRRQDVTHIINTAAYTAVDKAEAEPEQADKTNHQAVANLAAVAKAQGIALVHVSTDYVFDGRHCQPYAETDPVSPQGEYGKTKLAGEQALLAANPDNSLIIRTAWVYSTFGNNFVKTMLRLGSQRDSLGVVYDQVGSPTYARDLAAAIIAILPRLQHAGVELFHYSSEGVCSWYDFATTIFELSGIACRVNPIESHEYPTPAKRPHYSVLNKRKIRDRYGLAIPYWKNSLKQCLDAMPGPGH